MNDTPSLATWLADLTSRLAPRLDGGRAALLRATITLLCRQRDEGHSCVPLADWQGQSSDGEFTFPAVREWRDGLLATGLCGEDGGDERYPLVLGTADRLYLLRHWRTEQRLAAFVRARLQAPPLVTPSQLRTTLRDLGMLREGSAVDWQLAAITTAASRPFAILCGGPGTGKTTTVARLLAVLLRLRPGQRIALAAPTGKAAARLGQALRAHAAQHAELRAAAGSIEAKTLHRLLGYRPLEDAFFAGPWRPLPYDLVIVDEASMVDPAVLAVLCAALRPEAQLLLVGDKDQLAAVAAGHVLGDLCRSARPEAGAGADLAAFIAEATGMRLPVQDGASPTANATIHLRDNHRFGAESGIGAFARAMADRDAGAAMRALQAGRTDLQHVADVAAAESFLAERLVAAAAATSPDEALQRLGTARILTASNHGPFGAAAWNRRVEQLLAARGVRTDDPWYPGRPVLVTANDYQNQLWNGDLGVVVREDGGRSMVLFPTADGEGRRVAPSRLPPHETAWAMTVHKAQGSEFDDVLVSMPDRPGPLWLASLVYTGVTRARSRAMVFADPALLRPALANWPVRSSGLVDALAP